MSAQTKSDQTELLVQVIQEGMKHTVDKIVEQYIEEAKQKLTDAVPEIVSTLSLRIWKSVSLERFGHDLRITVDLTGGDNERRKKNN